MRVVCQQHQENSAGHFAQGAYWSSGVYRKQPDGMVHRLTGLYRNSYLACAAPRLRASACRTTLSAGRDAPPESISAESQLAFGGAFHW